MAVSLVWKIEKYGIGVKNLDNQNDVVNMVRYSVEATDGKYNSKNRGIVTITFDKEKPFTPFNKLTEAEVLEWVKESLGNKVPLIEKAAINHLDKIAKPVSKMEVKQNPWE